MPGTKPGPPLHGEHGVLATEQPGKSLFFITYFLDLFYFLFVFTVLLVVSCPFFWQHCVTYEVMVPRPGIRLELLWWKH